MKERSYNCLLTGDGTLNTIFNTQFHYGSPPWDHYEMILKSSIYTNPIHPVHFIMMTFTTIISNRTHSTFPYTRYQPVISQGIFFSEPKYRPHKHSRLEWRRATDSSPDSARNDDFFGPTNPTEVPRKCSWARHSKNTPNRTQNTRDPPQRPPD